MRRRSTDTHGAYWLRWPRWEAYQHADDGWIYPARIGREWYDPTQGRALPTELARVARAYRHVSTHKKFTEIQILKDDDSGDYETAYIDMGRDDVINKAIVPFLKRFRFLEQRSFRNQWECVGSSERGTSPLSRGITAYGFSSMSSIAPCLALIAS